MMSREEVLKIAKLARLELTDEEVKHYQQTLGRVLDYVRELNAVETPDTAIVKHVPKDAVAFREDKGISSGLSKELLKNAPEVESNCFLLPQVMEHE